MAGSGFGVSVVSSSLKFSQCDLSRLSLVVSDASPNPISELYTRVFWVFPEDVVILTGIKVEFFLQTFPA